MKLNSLATGLASCRDAMYSVAGCGCLVMATAALGQNQSPPDAHHEAPAAVAPRPGVQQLHAFSSARGSVPPAPWRVVGLPRGNKPLTQFDITPLDGHPVLRVQADHSYANLVHDLPDFALAPGVHLNWRWRLDQPLRQADLRHREGDDSPLKVCALFDLPIEQLGFVERNLLRAARSVTSEYLPAATLCYVWDARLPPGTLLHNAFTHRMRMIVLDSGEQRLGQWVTHTQDLAADFRRAFGQESPMLPPLHAVLVGADSDNTADRSLAYVGDITLVP